MRIFLLLLLGACVSESAVRGKLYMHDGIPAQYCAEMPALRELGIYRVVKCPNTKIRGCENGEPDYEEILPYCSERIKKFLSADRVDVDEWLRKATRPGRR